MTHYGCSSASLQSFLCTTIEPVPAPRRPRSKGLSVKSEERPCFYYARGIFRPCLALDVESSSSSRFLEQLVPPLIRHGVLVCPIDREAPAL